MPCYQDCNVILRVAINQLYFLTSHAGSDGHVTMLWPIRCALMSWMNLLGKKMIQLQQCFFLSLPLSSHLKYSACVGWRKGEAGKKSHLPLLRTEHMLTRDELKREKHGSQMTATLAHHPCMPKVTISHYMIKIKFLINLNQLLSWGGGASVQFSTNNHTFYGRVSLPSPGQIVSMSSTNSQQWPKH